MELGDDNGGTKVMNRMIVNCFSQGSLGFVDEFLI